MAWRKTNTKKFIIMKSNLCIIPARKGSKGIKNKNLRLVNKKELILHTFETAKKIENKFHIHVSTDSQRIYELAKKYQFEIDELRPKKLSGDYIEIIDVIKYELKKYLNKGVSFNNILLLQPTVPFRNYKNILKAIRILEKKKNYDSVVSISEVKSNHPYRMKVFDGKYIKNFCNFKRENMTSRQKLPKVYLRSGSIYLVRIKALMKNNSLVGKKTFGLILNGKETINIDNKIDLFIANNSKKIQSY